MTRRTKVTVSLASGVLLAALLTACGSGVSINGSTGASADATQAPAPTLIGTFIDAPVVGLGYSTNSGSGGCTSTVPCTTSSLGQFTYAPGES